MSYILDRIEKSFHLCMQGIDTENGSKNRINTYIDAMLPEFRANLIRHHAQINIEYSVLCSRLATEFKHTQPTELKHQLKDILKLAELLDIIYTSYLNVPREYNRLRQEQSIFRRWLKEEEKNTLINVTSNTTYTSKTIREKTSLYNFPRLLAVRVRRLLIAISLATDNLSTYRAIIAKVDKVPAFALTNLSWFYFIPRIADNLAMMIKHTIPLPYIHMSNEEKQLGWQNRLWIQWKARWADLSNDIPWDAANFVGYFILTGSWAYLGIVLSIAMQFYEILQSSMLYYVKIIKHLMPQLKVYQQLINNIDKNSQNYVNTKSYINHLEQHIKHESTRLIISITNASVLLIAIILAAPVFAFSPWFAITGGIIAVTTTLIAYFVQRLIPKLNGNLCKLLIESIRTESIPTESSTAESTTTNSPPGVQRLTDSLQANPLLNLFPLTESVLTTTGKPSNTGLFKPSTSPKSPLISAAGARAQPDDSTYDDKKEKTLIGMPKATMNAYAVNTIPNKDIENLKTVDSNSSNDLSRVNSIPSPYMFKNATISPTA